jgi:hypothetical protein
MKILFDQGTPVPLRRNSPNMTLPQLLNKAGLLYQESQKATFYFSCYLGL